MTRSFVVLVAASVSIAAAPRALAQPPAAEAAVLRLTLADAVERAKAHSPRLEELRALQQAADAGLRGAKAGRMPVVDLQASYAHHSRVPELTLELPGNPPRRIFPNLQDRFTTFAGLSLPLYTGGRVGGEIEAARHEALAAGKDVDAGLSDVVLETVTAYWDLVSARENERVLAESIAAYQADLKQVADRADVGMAARNDVLNVQVERDEAELSRLQAANNAAVANENLVRLLDLAPGSRVEPTEPMASAATPPEPVEDLVARALENRPEIAGLRARAAAAEAAVRVVRSATLPQASLDAGFDYARPNLRILPLTDTWNDSWRVGVNVSLRAFDGGRTSAAVAQARAQADAALRQLDDFERRVRLDVSARTLDLASRRAALEVAERNHEAARENVRVSQDRYREGLIPASDLLDAQQRLLQSGLSRTRSSTQLRQAWANLDRAVGR
jgi:outer membrane protein TolC